MIAYLILAHDNPYHLRRLVNALSSDSSVFFIHIDKKSSFSDFNLIGGKHILFSSNLTFSDWSAGGPSPALLSDKHLAFFRSNSAFHPDSLYGSGEMLFARKFSDEMEDRVNSLDLIIREKDNLPTTARHSTVN